MIYYGLLVRPMPWPLALMEIADRGLINGSRLLRLKLFGLARSPAPSVPYLRLARYAGAQAASFGR